MHVQVNLIRNHGFLQKLKTFWFLSRLIDFNKILFLLGFGFMFPMLLSYSNIGRAFLGEASKFLTLNAVGPGVWLIVTPYVIELILQECWWLSGGLFLHLLAIGIVAEINQKFQFERPTHYLQKQNILHFCLQRILFGMFGKIHIRGITFSCVAQTPCCKITF